MHLELIQLQERSAEAAAGGRAVALILNHRAIGNTLAEAIDRLSPDVA